MILAESSHYRITSEFETVFLEDTINHARTVIGEFYGDPEGAFITEQENLIWIVHAEQKEDTQLL